MWELDTSQHCVANGARSFYGAVVTTIRPVGTGDVAAVIALITRVLAEFDIRFGEGSATDDDLVSLPASYVDRGGAFWVAVDDDGHDSRVLGTIGIARLSATHLELRKMYLDPSTRGRGLGRQLLQLALQWADASGATHISLDTTEEMTAAQALYEQHGFTRDDRYLTSSRCTRGYVRPLGRLEQNGGAQP